MKECKIIRLDYKPLDLKQKLLSGIPCYKELPKWEEIVNEFLKQNYVIKSVTNVDKESFVVFLERDV